MRKLFEALPCKKRAFFLRTTLNQSLISSLLCLLEAAQDVLPPDVYQSSFKNLNSLNTEEKISSFLYALNSDFLQAFSSEDIPTIQKVVQNIADHKFQIEGINFFSIGDLASYHQELFKKIAVFEIPGDVSFINSPLEQHQKIKSLFQQGLALISKSCSDLYEEIEMFLGEILTFDSPKMKYGSSFNLFGMIYIRESFPFNTIVDVVDALAHEAGHIHLYSLSADDPLVLNPPEERYTAPLRTDKRPLIGIYHASFVVSRILYALRALYSHKLLSEEEQAYCATLIEAYKVKYALGFETVQKHATMSQLGQDILRSTFQLAS